MEGRQRDRENLLMYYHTGVVMNKMMKWLIFKRKNGQLSLIRREGSFWFIVP